MDLNIQKTVGIMYLYGGNLMKEDMLMVNLKYGETVGDKYWDGKCFVFDERGAIEIDPKKQKDNYSQCSICYVPNEEKHSCPCCEKEFIMCKACMPLIEDCCSKFCRNKLRMRYEEESKE